MTEEIIYFDEDGKITEKENAAKGVIREVDEKGRLKKETFFIINK